MSVLDPIIESAKDISLLYVEDDKDARMELMALLGLFFPHMIVATNGAEGLEAFCRQPVDLVISDVTMPVMDGIEMLRRLRLESSAFKSILITAHSSKDVLLEAIGLNVDGYILKPIEQEQLISVLSKIITIISHEKIKEHFDAALQLELQKQKATIESQSERLIAMLMHDALTGLENFEKLKIDYQACTQKPVLLLFNIDNFNFINLTHSYEIGDAIMQEVAQFLIEHCAPYAAVYKLYGDEFMVLLKELPLANAQLFAQEIQQKFSAHVFMIEEEEFTLSASMSLLECQAEDRVLPYHKVKLAMQEAKKQHKNAIAVYKQDLSLMEKQKELLKWARKTKEAITQGHLKPYFQPIYEFASDSITKYEVLARIVGKNEVITPFYFLPSAKALGLMQAVTHHIAAQAFDYFKTQSSVTFSINITDEDLRSETFYELLTGLCRETGITPSRVTLEILETISDYSASDAHQKIAALKAAGFVIAVDDFGAERSNFTRLQHLNVDIIKIDGLFIQDVNTNQNSRYIVETIIYLAKMTQKKTIAEFVHSHEVFEAVKALGVDYAQGYYIGTPQPEVVAC